MIRNDTSSLFTGMAGQNTKQRVDLSAFDGHRIAVVIESKNHKTVLRGTAAFVRDEAVGNSLRIQLDDEEPGQPVLMISEDQWDGRIIPDFHHGCSFCLIVN
jgi:hypothetical protein